MRRTKMRMASVSLVLFVSALVAVGPAAEPSGTLTVKDSEHPEALVNTDTRTKLEMTVLTPGGALEPEKEYDIRVEIHNPSARIEIVYMPGLTLDPVFTPAKKELRPDEYGPPLLFGRMSAKDERLNFVVLTGGDSYVRTYRWRAPDEGQVAFRAIYLNKRNGADIGVQAWTGKLSCQSEVMIISRQKKVERGAPADADKRRR